MSLKTKKINEHERSSILPFVPSDKVVVFVEGNDDVEFFQHIGKNSFNIKLEMVEFIAHDGRSKCIEEYLKFSNKKMAIVDNDMNIHLNKYFNSIENDKNFFITEGYSIESILAEKCICQDFCNETEKFEKYYYEFSDYLENNAKKIIKASLNDKVYNKINIMRYIHQDEIETYKDKVYSYNEGKNYTKNLRGKMIIELIKAYEKNRHLKKFNFKEMYKHIGASNYRENNFLKNIFEKMNSKIT